MHSLNLFLFLDTSRHSPKPPVDINEPSTCINFQCFFFNLTCMHIIELYTLDTSFTINENQQTDEDDSD